MGWGSVLHNALNDAKRDLDPRGAVKFAEHALDPKFQTRLGNAVIDQGKRLVTHPIREFQHHPVDTALAALPIVGKAAGAASDASVAAEEANRLKYAVTGNAKAGQLGHRLEALNDFTRPSRVPGRMRDELLAWKMTKHDKGSGVPRNPYGGSTFGATLDPQLLGKLQAELGHPNITHEIAETPPGMKHAQGGYNRQTQESKVFLTPRHFHDPDPTSAEQNLVETMTHEARHGWQMENWSRPRRFIDSHRFYENQKAEKDANQFMRGATPRYKGLVKINPAARGHFMGLDTEPLPTDLKGLTQAAIDVHQGLVGTSEEAYLNHLEALVKQGVLEPDHAIDLEELVHGNLRKGVYQPPRSKTELLQRAITQARR